MPKVIFENTNNESLQYVVIAAQYQGQWVFVRNRRRSTWEIPGGHIEPGETAEVAARRELWEETGATRAELHPVSVYGVRQKETTTFGMLYIAKIWEWEPLSDAFEIGERQRSYSLPPALTYPDIYPILFEKVQIWLNLQCSPDELWDIYDEDRRLTGRTHRRSQPMKKGEYHLVVHVWMVNRRGQFLLTKRSPSKGFPNAWETTCGSALAGDDSLAAALREVKEETGLTLDPSKGTLISSVRRGDNFRDAWLFRQNFDLKDVELQPGETIDKAYMGKAQIQDLFDSGEFVPCDYLEEVFQAASLT